MVQFETWNLIENRFTRNARNHNEVHVQRVCLYSSHNIHNLSQLFFYVLFLQKGMASHPIRPLKPPLVLYLLVNRLRACSSCTVQSGYESSNWSVCMPLSHLFFLYWAFWQWSSLATTPCWPVLSMVSIAPLSCTAPVTVGVSICPVSSCSLTTLLSAKPCISSCKSLRGRSKARQQDKEQCGFLRHSVR